MAEQDETSALRDIIRHDVMMDARALEKVANVRNRLNSIWSGPPSDRAVLGPEMEAIFDQLVEIETCIKSTLADTKKAPGLAVQFEIVEADRPE